MKTNENVREMVSEAYTKAITSPAEGSCCQSTSCCGGVSSQNAITEQAGYTIADLESIPSEMASSSFGCGNPLAFSEVKEGETVVDLGSGAGLDLLIASKKVGPTGYVIGIDMTDAMIAKARENIEKAGVTNVEIRKGLIEKLPVDDSSVDWIISNCVINLSPEKSNVFSEIHRVLKPGGKILISDIVVEDLPEWLRQDDMLYSACVAGAVSEDEYIAGLRESGLDDVKVQERLVYQKDQIKSFIQTDEIPGLRQGLKNISEPARSETIDQMIGSVVGKVWSAKFFATKPQKEQCCQSSCCA